MQQFVKRLRGVVGLSLTWGAVWAAIFTAVFLIIMAVNPAHIDMGETSSLGIAIGAACGFVTGVSFSILMLLGERGKALRDISLAT